jgi:hypothetical protein
MKKTVAVVAVMLVAFLAGVPIALVARVVPPIWVDDQGRRVPTRPCPEPGRTREWAIRRYRFEHLPWSGWPTQPMFVVNWCGHGQQFVPWPEADGYWTLVPVVEAVAQ